MKRLSADRPWRCINCKTQARDDQETCVKCGDRLILKKENGRGAEGLDPTDSYPRQQTYGAYQMSDEYAEALLNAAIGYATAGIAVFPLRLYRRGEGKKGVSPIASWRAASTTDLDVIREWFGVGGDWRGTAVAIDTGKSGLTVIDLDVTEGKDGIAAWERENTPSPMQVRTPTGGRHHYFRADVARPVTVHNRGEVADGIDVRGEGGFVIAPPSIDPRGGSWEWVA